MIFSFSDRIDKMVFSSSSSLINETAYFRNFSFPIPNRPLTVSQPEKLWTCRRSVSLETPLIVRFGGFRGK